ncbi:hypothetical protein E2C01_029195 [Portunus trituberculatus]|uniref:Uncharacterized protein n=1 Tax=Portunus trituberculatus TaxID=210409 RepID=A0A5B7EME4_PORTR|nr:hypothetical protein [Portunus trituberculatus]
MSFLVVTGRSPGTEEPPPACSSGTSTRTTPKVAGQVCQSPTPRSNRPTHGQLYQTAASPSPTALPGNTLRHYYTFWQTLGKSIE